ncbi:hypothetical protein MKW94_022011 [Papaver nudicaule]|uniref:Uncharacterized protein n=1 Tax=Papaver nudicaule TaxID=74823 RepID=A0AA41V914_PAPNU|nr:hypothetical protein [Papaver nudicaule]
MELNDLSHVHFIQAIRGGLVSQIINVNSLGRPALKFKTLKSIYESIDSNKAGISGSPYRSDRFETKMTTGDYEEVIAADISLGEIKRRYKAKRKKITELESHEKDTCFSSSDISIELSYTGEQRKDEADLDLPISSLKLKPSKKLKLTQRCFQKCGFTSLGCQEAFAEKIPHSPQDSSQNVENMHTHSDVLNQCSESLDDVVNLADGSICMSDSVTGSSGFLSHEVPRWLNEELEEQTSSAKASSTSLCIVHEPINIKLEPSKTDSVISVTDSYPYVSCSDMDFGKDKYHIPSTFNGNESRSGISTFVTEEVPGCVINEVPSECLETGKSTFLIEESSSCAVNEEPNGHLEFVTALILYVDDAGIVREISDVELPQLSPVLESDDEGLSVGDAEIIKGMTDVELRQLSNQDSPSSELTFKNVGVSINDAEIVRRIGESDSTEDQPLITEDNVVDAEISFMSSQNSTQCSRLGTNSDCVGQHSPTVQSVEMCSSPAIDEPVPDLVQVPDCSTVTSPDATNRIAVMEVLEDHHGREFDYPPKRLFSARKAISPSSREKLLQAVDADELCDKIKPSTGIRIIGPKVKINPDGVLKKRKIMKNGSVQLVPKGILKTANVSFMVPRPGTECASIQTCADEAVAFTQRQMHDIEGLAMKLMKQLKSMKEIVEQSLLTETLQTDSCSSTQLKYTVDKMRMATENATEAEETTRKWLSMMSKDCNRFCKILKTTEMKAAAASPPPSSYEVHKKRRKVTFADETGGILCQIKIFEDDHEYLLVPESEMSWRNTKLVEATCRLNLN